MDIDAIKGQFKDYARPNLFVIQFSRIPSKEEKEDAGGGSLFDKIKSAATKILKDFFAVPTAQTDAMINLGAKTASFPSMVMQAPELEYRGYKMPTVGPVVFGEFNATFVLDHDLIIYNYFANWLNKITNIYTGQGLNQIHGTDQVSEIKVYQIKGDMDISGGYLITLEEAYPINISEIEFSENEGFSEVRVGFRYTNIKNENIETDMSRDEAGSASLLDKAKGFIGGYL